MSGVLNNHPNIPFAGPLQALTHMLGCLGLNDIYRIVTNRAAILSGIDITGQAGTVGPNGVARVVGPDGIIDTHRVFGMPCGIEPLLCDGSAALLVKIGLVFVANRAWRNATDELAVYSIIESDPLCLCRPRRRLWSLFTSVKGSIRCSIRPASYKFTR
jgi:hypothetical protein